MIWKPAKTLGLVAGFIIGLTLFAVGLLLVTALTSQSLGLWFLLSVFFIFCSLSSLILWAYWYFCLLSLRYDLDRNRLMIRAAGVRHVIPMGAIEQVLLGSELTASSELRGVNWPGFYRGKVPTLERGTVHVHSTRPLDQQLVVVAGDTSYGISPAQPERFLEDLRARRALGAIRELEPSDERTGIASWHVWGDRLYWALCLVSAVANATLLALVLTRLRDLDIRAPLRAGGLGAESWRLLVPGIGALSWLVNILLGLSLYRRERPAAYLLVLGTLAIQIIVWIAGLRLIA